MKHLDIISFSYLLSGGEKRPRLELRKTKALLRDAETVLQKMGGAEGTKAIIKQLRNRVSDWWRVVFCLH